MKFAKLGYLALLAAFLSMPLFLRAGTKVAEAQNQPQMNQNQNPNQNQNQNQAVVFIRNSQFQPSVIHVKPGTTVVWRNEDKSPHTVTSNDFDSGKIDPGGSYSHTFNAKGTFDYHCTLDPNMQGRVIVQ